MFEVSCARHLSYERAMGLAVLPDLINDIRTASAGASRRTMNIPVRDVIRSEDGRGFFVTMPAFSDRDNLFVVKVGTILLKSPVTHAPTVDAIVIAYSGRTGEIIGTINGRAITNIKCAALAGFITQLCTYDCPHTVAILGSGVQAMQQVWALSTVKVIKEIRIFSRRTESASRFVEQLSHTVGYNFKSRVAMSVDEAIRGASIIGTATTSTEPLGAFDDLPDDIHINCMGGHTVSSREIPNAVLERSVLIVEDKSLAIKEAGVIHSRAIEVEDLLSMTEIQRRPTVFSSTGHAFYAYCATKHVLERAGMI